MDSREMQREIDRLESERVARAEVIEALTREVADLRCILRGIRDATSEETIRVMASMGLVQ